MFCIRERSPEETERAGGGLDIWHAGVATLRPEQAVDEEEEDESEFRLAGRHGSGCQEGDRRSERLAEHTMLEGKARERHDVSSQRPRPQGQCKYRGPLIRAARFRLVDKVYTTSNSTRKHEHLLYRASHGGIRPLPSSHFPSK